MKDKIPYVQLLNNFVSMDERGDFVKSYNHTNFDNIGVSFPIQEIYYSTNHKNVVRGMHFQIPPHDHCKLVCVVQGSITDVVLDIRPNSPTFGVATAFELTAHTNAVFIPRGYAHGFCSRESGTIVLYAVETVHSKESDRGIRYDSFGYDWKIKGGVIVSPRDLQHPDFEKINPEGTGENNSSRSIE